VLHEGFRKGGGRNTVAILASKEEADRQRLAEIFLEFINGYNSAAEKLIKEIRARPLKFYKPPKALQHLHGKSR
jgi:hypothetical protein